MEKIDICIIKPNKYNTNKIPKQDNKKYDIQDEPNSKFNYKRKLNYANIEQFKDDTKDFIEFRTVNKEDVMITIEDFIESKLEFVNVTDDIYQDRQFLFQLCFKDIYHDLVEKKEMNYIASELTNEDKAIAGTVVILKESIPEDNLETTLNSITYEDIFFLIMNENIHAGVIIHDNSKLTQIYFNNKLKLVNLDKNNSINNMEKNYFLDENYEGYKESILKFDFNIYVRKSNSYEKGDVNFNVLASRIYNMKIEGDSLFIGKDFDSDKYYDIFVEDITDILNLKQENKKCSEKDGNETKDTNNLKIYKSRHRVLYSKLK